MPSLETPKTGLEALAVLVDEGHGKYVYPCDVSGPFSRWRQEVRVALIAIFAATPWIQVGGHPVIFVDSGDRRSVVPLR